MRGDRCHGGCAGCATLLMARAASSSVAGKRDSQRGWEEGRPEEAQRNHREHRGGERRRETKRNRRGRGGRRGESGGDAEELQRSQRDHREHGGGRGERREPDRARTSPPSPKPPVVGSCPLWGTPKPPKGDPAIGDVDSALPAAGRGRGRGPRRGPARADGAAARCTTVRPYVDGKGRGTRARNDAGMTAWPLIGDSSRAGRDVSGRMRHGPDARTCAAVEG